MVLFEHEGASFAQLLEPIFDAGGNQTDQGADQQNAHHGDGKIFQFERPAAAFCQPRFEHRAQVHPEEIAERALIAARIFQNLCGQFHTGRRDKDDQQRNQHQPEDQHDSTLCHHVVEPVFKFVEERNLAHLCQPFGSFVEPHGRDTRIRGSCLPVDGVELYMKNSLKDELYCSFAEM